MNPETKIELDAVNLILENLGITSIKIKTAGNNGYPDRLFFIPGGKPLFIEFKRPGEELQPLQDRIIKTLWGLEYKVKVCNDSVDALEAAIEAVESTRLPKESREILTRARGRCAFLRSRAWEDRDHTSSD